MHSTDALKEADRLMTVCNACRYCEGLCAVFPAMEMRRSFVDGDLNYLANLCHGCGACQADCQFASPHEFNVNVPRTLAKVRKDSYASYAWPSVLSRLYERNGVAISVLAAASVAIFLLAFIGVHDAGAVFRAYPDGQGAFYALMPHAAMAWLFSAVFVYAVLAIVIGVRRFWRDVQSGEVSTVSADPRTLWQAAKDAMQLRYLDGGGVGCYNEDEYPTDRRRLFHHLTFYGFLLCFASTSVATLYHYLLAREAPYPWYDLPVLLGMAGGIGLIVGPLGLLGAKRKRDALLEEPDTRGMDVAFILMLFLTGLTGIALLFLRETSLMGVTLAAHLGVVFALFLTMPYGKFVHGIYRFAALVRYAAEKKEIIG